MGIVETDPLVGTGIVLASRACGCEFRCCLMMRLGRGCVELRSGNTMDGNWDGTRREVPNENSRSQLPGGKGTTHSESHDSGQTCLASRQLER